MNACWEVGLVTLAHDDDAVLVPLERSSLLFQGGAMLERASRVTRIFRLESCRESVLTTFCRNSLAKTEWAANKESPSTTGPAVDPGWTAYSRGSRWKTEPWPGLPHPWIVESRRRHHPAPLGGWFILRTLRSRMTSSSRRSMRSIFCSLQGEGGGQASSCTAILTKPARFMAHNGDRDTGNKGGTYTTGV